MKLGSAMGKRKTDMLNGPIWSNVLFYALPIAATGILGQLFNASDIAVVGNFSGSLGKASVAAVGSNSPIVGLIVNLFVSISLGTNVIIANAIGRDDKDAVSKAVHTSVVASIIFGLFTTILGELISKSVLKMLNVPDEVFDLSLQYLRIYFLGMPVILLYNFEAAIFRSEGDTKTPLIVLTVSGILNVVLNLFFVIVFNMAVMGVAIATVISNAVSAVVLFKMLLSSNKYIKIEMDKLKIDFECLKQILKIGLPAGLQSAVFSISNIVIQSAINSLGTVVMAASSAAFNLEIIAYYVLNSFSQACTTFVGQNHGAGNLKRCKKTLHICLIEDLIASAITIVTVLFAGKFLLSLFNNDPEVIRIGYVRLLIIFSAYIFSMLYEVMSGYLRGFGISLVPAILTMLGVCVIRIIWIQTVFPKSPTFETIMTVYPISLATTAVLIFIAVLAYHPVHKILAEEKKVREIC